MKAWIEVKGRKEAEAIRRGLDDPSTRALVLVVSVLSTLPSDRARARCLHHVADMLDEKATTPGEDVEEKA